MEDFNYLTERPLFKCLITISLPMLAANLLHSVLEVVALYIVGRLGPDISREGVFPSRAVGLIVFLSLGSEVTFNVGGMGSGCVLLYSTQGPERLSIMSDIPAIADVVLVNNDQNPSINNR